jgi:hypothetical protein
LLGEARESVIPEGAKSACGGESRKTKTYWIPDLAFVSSGMTIIFIFRLY